jgi:dTDP-4-amino-4,6-dideoxygalactose transaminase
MNNMFWFGVYPGLDDNQLEYIFEKSKEFLMRF